MDALKAIKEVKKTFLSKIYFEENLDSWVTVDEVVQTYLTPGDKVFDLSSRPCDKTAVAQLVGYECT